MPEPEQPTTELTAEQQLTPEQRAAWRASPDFRAAQAHLRRLEATDHLTAAERQHAESAARLRSVGADLARRREELESRLAPFQQELEHVRAVHREAEEALAQARAELAQARELEAAREACHPTEHDRDMQAHSQAHPTGDCS